MTEWSPTSWKSKPAAQQPRLPREADVARVVDEISKLPPLVTSWEIHALQTQLAEAARGERFLLQGGDCAESFDHCDSGTIANKLKILLQMSLVLAHGRPEAGDPRGPLRRPVRQAALRRFRNARRRHAAQLSRRPHQPSRVHRGRPHAGSAADAARLRARRPDAQLHPRAGEPRLRRSRTAWITGTWTG